MKILIIGILFAILAFVFRKRFNVYIGFLPIFIVMAFQDGLQTDIINYEVGFNNVKELGDIGYNLNIGGFTSEIGWVTLNRIFTPFNFRIFLLFVVFVQYIILCKFVQKYVDKEYQYLSGILFYLTFNMMLMQMTAIRQGLAIELTLLAYMVADRKKLIPTLLFCAVAYSIHTTSILTFPFIFGLYLIKGKNVHKNKIQHNEFVLPITITSIYAFVHFTKGAFINQVSSMLIYVSAFGYENYFNELDNFELSTIYVIYNGIIIFFASWYMQQASQSLRFFSILTIIGCFGEMLVFGLGSLPRIFMYFQISNIIIIPNITAFLQKRFGFHIAILLVMLCLGYGYKSTLPHMHNEKYKNFHFLLETDYA